MDQSHPSTKIGRYEVIRKVGAGGMGELFLARMIGPGGISKQVCIKRTLPDRAMDPRAVQRSLDEARTALTLQHANVVPVFDFGRDESGLFLVMEWIDGCDLQVLLQRARDTGLALPPLVAVFIAAEVCKALAYAHERRDGAGRASGLVHGDVTPRNILLSRLGEVRLADFGVARAMSAPGGPAGTPLYMAPEQARAEPADGRSDLYSLGLVLAEMLLARPLRDDESMESARRPVLVPPLGDVDPEIAAIVHRLLAAEPERRFPAAASAQAALLALVAAEMVRGAEPLPRRVARLVAEAAPRLPEGGQGPGRLSRTQAKDTRDGWALPAAGRRRRLHRVAIGALLLALGAGTGAVVLRHPGTVSRPPAARTGRLVAGPSPAPPPREAPPPALEPPRSGGLRTPRSGRLRIKAPGSWLSIFVDGEKLGDDAGEFEVAVGRHRLHVVNPPLHFERNEWIVVRPGDTVTREYSVLQ